MRSGVLLAVSGSMDLSIAGEDLETGVAAVDAGWRVTAWSPSAARLTGRASDGVLGGELWSALPALHRHPIEETLQEVLADGVARTVMIPVRASEGGEGQLEIEVCRVDDHLLFLIRSAPSEANVTDLSLGRDIWPEDRLGTRLFEILPLPALLLTGEGRILQANAAAAGLLRAPTGTSLGGRSLADWIPTPPLFDILRRADRGVQRVTVALELPDGSPSLEAQLVITAVAPDPGAAPLLCLVAAVPRELLLQDRLVQQDRLAPLGALAAGIAHELRDPVAVIAAFAASLRDGAREGPVAEHADMICAAAREADRVVQALLDFTRRRAPTPRAVELTELLDRVLVLRRGAPRDARISFHVTVAPGTPPVWGDPQLLQQVLCACVVDAEQAITVSGAAGQIAVAGRACDGRVVVTITDSGPGIPADELGRVFHPFVTTRGGTGAGLGLSHGIVRELGGRMWVQNVAGDGVRLSLELPVGPAMATAPSRPRKILVFDAHAIRRRSTQLRTQRLGHGVMTAAGWREGRDLLDDPAVIHDAILIDVDLDGEDSGFDVYEALRREGRGREGRVIFTTGDTITPATCSRLDAVDRPVLRTPCALDELRELLGRLPVVSA